MVIGVGILGLLTATMLKNLLMGGKSEAEINKRCALKFESLKVPPDKPASSRRLGQCRGSRQQKARGLTCDTILGGADACYLHSVALTRAIYPRWR
eukprot:1298295-Pyramimonas_sp.AAC.1